MPYADFRLESVEEALGVQIRLGELFPAIEPLPVPAWLGDMLARGREAAPLVSEKARSEFLVVPILLAVREAYPKPLAIFSGQRLDVDPSLGLIGECDFILALTSPVPRLKSPLVTIVEAKKGDIEAGLGQCIAQAVAARLFNDRAGESERSVFGCVTSGDDWQFLRLTGSEVVLDPRRLYLDQVGGILATLRAILVGAGANRESP
jgi:hypothetical protein